MRNNNYQMRSKEGCKMNILNSTPPNIRYNNNRTSPNKRIWVILVLLLTTTMSLLGYLFSLMISLDMFKAKDIEFGSLLLIISIQGLLCVLLTYVILCLSYNFFMKITQILLISILISMLIGVFWMGFILFIFLTKPDYASEAYIVGILGMIDVLLQGLSLYLASIIFRTSSITNWNYLIDIRIQQDRIIYSGPLLTRFIYI